MGEGGESDDQIGRGKNGLLRPVCRTNMSEHLGKVEEIQAEGVSTRHRWKAWDI